MELRKLITTKDGEVHATWVLTQDQMAVLYWYAINDLIGKGLAEVVEISPEQLEDLKKEQEQQFLASTNTEDLPRA